MNRPKPFHFDLSPLPLTHEAAIPDTYRDAMGHMNVMWYTHLFDVAVYGAFELIGLTTDYMRENHAGGFALEVHIRYLAEVHVGEEVAIYTRFLGRSSKRFHLLNFMHNRTTDRLAATFEVVGAHIDMRVRRMADMPESISDQLDRIVHAHRQLDWAPPVCGIMRP